MTVTNKKAHPVLSNLGTLLQPEETGGESQLKATALANKVATATKVLATTPSLHALALEVVSNGLLFQCSMYDHSPQLAQEGTLATSLSEVWVLLESLLSHCPQGWSSKLFKWSVNLLGRFSISYKSPSSPEEATRAWLNNPLLAPVHSFVKKCADYLVESGLGLQCMECLFPACSMHAPNLNWLLAHVVSLHPSSLIPLLLHHALSSSSSSSSLSLSSNSSLDPSFTTLTQALTHLSRTHRDTLRDCIVSTVTDLLSSTKKPELPKILFLLRVASECPPVLEIAAAQCLERVSPSGIHELLIHSMKLLSSRESHDSFTNHSNGSDEEDEGEIVSDEEEMQVDSGKKTTLAIRQDEVVQLFAKLVCQLKGTEACMAINKIIDTHTKTEQHIKTQEDAMEEGEIVHDTTGKAVAESCKVLMVEILTRMHSSACLPHLIPGQAQLKTPPTGQGQQQQQSQGGDGCGLELTIGLQCGLEQWCKQLLELIKENPSNALGQRCSWIQEVITCVCICSSEFQAAMAMAQLLSLSTNTQQLSKVLEIYWELQVRHSHLAHTTVQAAISSAQHHLNTVAKTDDCSVEDETEGQENREGVENGGNSLKGNLFNNFITNLLVILSETEKKEKEEDGVYLYDIATIRCQFLCALSEQLLYLTQLLAPSLLLVFNGCQDTNRRQLLSLFDLIYSILNQEGENGGSSSSSSSSSSSTSGGVLRLSSQSLFRVLQALLSHYISMIKMAALSILKAGHSELALEAALGKCRRTIVWCATYNYASISTPVAPPHSTSATIMVYTTVLDAVLSKDLGCYFSSQGLTKVQSSSLNLSSGKLLSTNSHLGLSSLHGAKQSTRRVHHTGSLQQRNQKTSVENNKEDFTQSSVSHTLCHLMKLIQDVTSSDPTNKDILASVLMDKLAPHATELKQWPDDDSLKHTLEWDLSIRRKLDSNPVLWDLLLCVAEGGRDSSSLIVCAPVVRALLTVLSQHWQRCRVNKTTMFPKELASSIALIECLARAEWLPKPLCYIGELFTLITPFEAHLLLSAVQSYLKTNYTKLKSKQYHQLKNTGYRRVVKGVLIKNIDHFGSLYTRYMCTSNNGNESQA